MKLKGGGSKKGRNNKSAVCRMQKKRCYRKKSIRTRKERDLASRIQDREKEAMVELRSGSTLYREKSTTEWCMDRGSKKYTKEGE